MDKAENEIFEIELALTKTNLFRSHDYFDSGNGGLGYAWDSFEFLKAYLSKIRDFI